MWDIPGGHAEAHENDVDALTRELREELGIAVVDVGSPFAVIDSAADDVSLAFYRVDTQQGTPMNLAPDEHDHIAWFGITEAWCRRPSNSATSSTMRSRPTTPAIAAQADDLASPRRARALPPHRPARTRYPGPRRPERRAAVPRQTRHLHRPDAPARHHTVDPARARHARSRHRALGARHRHRRPERIIRRVSRPHTMHSAIASLGRPIRDNGRSERRGQARLPRFRVRPTGARERPAVRQRRVDGAERDNRNGDSAPIARMRRDRRSRPHRHRTAITASACASCAAPLRP